MEQIQQTGMANKPSSRLVSLDALRGFDMFWIVCGEGIFHGIANAVMANHSLTRNPVDWQIATIKELSLWEHMAVGISNQLHHTPWNGFTFYDMIFPLFIFIAGISMPFSFNNQLQKAGLNKAIAKKNIYRSLIKRTILLILLGMVVNGAFKFDGYENTRFASVLGRIALSCFFAAIIYLNCSLQKQFIWFVVLLHPKETYRLMRTEFYCPVNFTGQYMIRKEFYPPFPQSVQPCWVFLQDSFYNGHLKNGVNPKKE
jgi:predicted acyltransferase